MSGSYLLMYLENEGVSMFFEIYVLSRRCTLAECVNIAISLRRRRWRRIDFYLTPGYVTI
jgi:hypothetical protein